MLVRGGLVELCSRRRKGYVVLYFFNVEFHSYLRSFTQEDALLFSVPILALTLTMDALNSARPYPDAFGLYHLVGSYLARTG